MRSLLPSALIFLIGTIIAFAGGNPSNSTSNRESVRPIGSIDFYGLHHLTPETLRNELTFKVGDPVTIGDRSHAFFEASRQRLMMVPGVSNAHVDVICCTDARPVVFVGIEERDAVAPHFRSAPTGSVRLPPQVLRVSEKFDRLIDKAVMSGNAEEDDSEGHTMLKDPTARPTEDRLIAIADTHLKLLREVLHDSADQDHRARAAQLLGYSKSQQQAVPDLVYAMADPSSDVRNNAMRALWVFTMGSKVEPPRVPFAPFIALLNSTIWSDRNKSSLALMQMAGSRNPVLLAELREQAFPSLVEMARWADRDHAIAAFWILGCMAGFSDEDISNDWSRNERERVVAAAHR